MATILPGTANERLPGLEPGSARLVVTSPRYLDLIDYEKAARREGEGWREASESVHDYVLEHSETCAHLYHACAPDAVVAVEIDDYLVPRAQTRVPLVDFWKSMLVAAGFRIAESITLGRTLAIGRRSGHFKRYQGRPGYFLPDNVTSTVIVAMKGDPLARIRRDAPDGYTIDVAWAERFLKNLWMVPPPRRRSRKGHPVPMDADVVRALIRFYSLPSDLVIDPFAGSGTTLRIAAEEGRAAIGVERVADFCRMIAGALGRSYVSETSVEPVRIYPGAQIYFDFDPTLASRFRAAFLSKSSKGEVTERVREMARVATEESGVQIPPEFVALLLRAERAHYSARTSGKRKATAA